MKVEIKVPSMGESISEATVGQILKASGSQVAMDDEVLELETDKVNQVLFAPQAGTITINVNSGDAVKIGQVIGFVDTDQKEQKTFKPESKPAPEKKEEPKVVPQKEGAPARKTREDYVAAIKEMETEPSAKTAAPEVKPVKAAAPEVRQVGKRQETRKKMSRIREVISKRLVEVKQNTAMLTTFNEVDMSQVMMLREKYKELFQKEHGVKLGFLSFFVKAAVHALTTFPELNSYIDGNEMVHREYFDIGIAVSTDRGLLVPVIRDCDKLSFAAIEKSVEDYAKKAREGTISVDDLQGGGFTITNGGVFGSMLSTPILNGNQPAILGMHKIVKRPVVVDDQIVIRPIMYLALSYDHRIVDGKEAVSFLVEIKNFLEDPARLVLDV